jgi:hypothetical protein
VGILFMCRDEPELQEVVVAMLEMRSLPLLCAERAKHGVRVNRLGVIMKMSDEAADFMQ